MSAPADLHRELEALRRENARLRAEREAAVDPDEFRRALLVRAWRTGYFGMRRTSAAKAIAADWAAFATAPHSTPADGAALIFRELHRAGVRPLAWRQIADIIDPDL